MNEGETGGNVNMQGAEDVKMEEFKYTQSNRKSNKRVKGGVEGDECLGDL